MSRDIRSYFQNIKTNASVSTTKTKKRRIISSDEDDEKSESPVKQSKKTKTLNKSTDNDVKQKQIVSPAEVFGKKPISRQEAPKVSKRLQKKEAEGHKDDDFESTLSQLDTSDIEKKYLTECNVDKDSDLHVSSICKDRNETVQNKDNIKEEKTHNKIKGMRNKTQNELKRKKHSNSSSNEDIEHDVLKHTTNSEPNKDSSAGTSAKTVLREKVSPKKNEICDVYEERIKKRKEHAVIYQQYLQRGGARNPGSKEIPIGAEYCLAGLSFLITGVLDSLERDEVEELIKKYGGRILHQPSKNTDYAIIGDQPGTSKLSKVILSINVLKPFNKEHYSIDALQLQRVFSLINNLNIKKISEDDLLEMIRTRPPGRVDDIKQSRANLKDKAKQNFSKSEEVFPPSPNKAETGTKAVELENLHSPSKRRYTDKDEQKLLKISPHKKGHDNKCIRTQSPIEKDQSQNKTSIIQNEKEINDIKINGNVSSQALVEKYRPKTLKQILGQQGEKSNAKKLYNWLLNWHKNQSGQVKHIKPSPWSKNDDGAFFKAALLSGPPGIGKTTTAQVVCNELGFDLIEFNASDTRSKKLLKEEVSELLSNTTLKDYFADCRNKATSKHVLLMDEVDGMAGNEDRGGLQELINLIKSTDIPIICICNDRNSPKIRTLANYTYDLRFQKPRLEQIRGAMRTICYKENINISTEDLDRLIESTNQDIRQVINHLALFVGNTASQEKSDKQHVNKDLKLGPWDVVRKVFSVEEHKRMSIHDKSDLFFHDYNIAPLFVQENYLLVIPQVPKSEVLGRIAECAESLAVGDIVEKSIRSNNAWSLLPIQACYSCVIPGTVMSGHIGGQINFPAWLGRNSKANKFNRLIQEITMHVRLTTGASKEAVNLDYIKSLRNAIIGPLANNGVENVDKAINIMNQYHLLREDLDSLIEVSLWPGDRDPMQAIDSKVKAAFTRAYNKSAITVPYIVNAASNKKPVSNLQNEDFIKEEDEEEVNSDENSDTIETDKMIKAKKPAASKQTESKNKSTSGKTSKRGRGRGKAK